jgi:surface antigen
MRFTRITASVAAIAMAVSLSACENAGTKETAGTLVGAGLGGLAGSFIGSGAGRAAAIAGGVIIGGLIGNQIGKHLDQQDRAYAQNTASRSMASAPTGTSSSWRNPDSGNSGTVTPTTDTYTGPNGRPCRDFNHSITLANGQQDSVKGTMCMNPNGSWETI